MVRGIIFQQSGVSCLGGCRAAGIVLRNKGCDFLSERRWKVREVPNCQSKTESWGCDLAGGQRRDNKLSDCTWFTVKEGEIEP